MSLRVLPSSESSTDCGCSRRTLLQGAAVVTAGAVVAGCGGNSSGDDDVDIDAPPMGDTGITMCGNNLCIDLTNANNSGLAAVGGFKTVVAPAPHGKLVIAQPTANTFVAMSAICTHAGCTVGFNKTANLMACPCHGSKFNTDGTVNTGPATRDLKTFATAVDGAMVLTITLA